MRSCKVLYRATQLNSTSSWVELRRRSLWTPLRCNSTNTRSSWVKLCRSVQGLSKITTSCSRRYIAEARYSLQLMKGQCYDDQTWWLWHLAVNSSGLGLRSIWFRVRDRVTLAAERKINRKINRQMPILPSENNYTCWQVVSSVVRWLCVAITILLLCLARRHKQMTEKERAKLYQSRRRTERIVDRTTMVSGILQIELTKLLIWTYYCPQSAFLLSAIYLRCKQYSTEYCIGGIALASSCILNNYVLFYLSMYVCPQSRQLLRPIELMTLGADTCWPVVVYLK